MTDISAPGDRLGADDPLARRQSEGERAEPQGFAAQAAWTLTEPANEVFFTLVIRYVFSAYFVGHVAATSAQGDAMWASSQAIGGLAVAILAPVAGSYADAAGPRKGWIAFFALLAIGCCASLWWSAPGSAALPVIIAVTAAAIAVETMLAFTNAVLPSVASSRRAGLLSGITFGFGQLAGIIALVTIILLSEQANPLGMPKETRVVDRLSGPIAAAAILVFLVPLFLFVKDEPRRSFASRSAAATSGVKTLWATFREAVRNRNMRIFLIGRAFGSDGMSTVFAFGGILAARSFGWSADQLAVFGIVVTVFSAAGGFLGGFIDMRLGSRISLVSGLALVALGTAGILSTDETRLFGMPFGGADAPVFRSPQEIGFMISGAVIALGAGPVFASMRGLMAKIAPLDRMTAYFGVYAMVGKATNFLGPAVVLAVASSTGSLRIGLCVAFVFLAIGAWSFAQVKPERLA